MVIFLKGGFFDKRLKGILRKKVLK